MHTVRNLKGETVEIDDEAYGILMDIRAKDPDREIPFEEGTVINYKADWDMKRQEGEWFPSEVDEE